MDSVVQRWTRYRAAARGRDETLAALKLLADYMYGTPENPRKHYLLWFKMEQGDNIFTVSFDSDGDAYINTSDDKMIMTEFKIRSAHLVFIPDNMTAVLDFVALIPVMSTMVSGY